MSWKLSYNLFRLRQKAGPTKQFRSALRYKLSEHYDSLYPVSKAFAWRLMVMRYGVMAVVVLLVAASIGTGAYAYDNPGVNEASLLYPVKKTIEKVQGKLVQGSVAKANFQLKQMQRRQAEIDRLQAEQKQFEKTIEEFNQAEEAVLANTDNVTSEDERGIMIQKVTEANLAHLQKLQDVKDELPSELQPRLEKVITAQSERMEKKLDNLQDKQDKFLEKQLEKLEQAEDWVNKQQEKIMEIKERVEINKEEKQINQLPANRQKGDQGRARQDKNKN